MKLVALAELIRMIVYLSVGSFCLAAGIFAPLAGNASAFVLFIALICFLIAYGFIWIPKRGISEKIALYDYLEKISFGMYLSILGACLVSAGSFGVILHLDKVPVLNIVIVFTSIFTLFFFAAWVLQSYLLGKFDQNAEVRHS